MTYGTEKPVYSQDSIDPEHPLITQSFLTMFEACGYAAFRRYVEGEKVPPGIAAVQGRATDAAVTFGANQVISTGKDATLEDKLGIASEVYDKESPDALIQEGEDRGQLKDETVGLVTLHHNEIAPLLKPVKTQEAIRVDLDTYSLAGTIDIIEEEHNLVDTKTSKRRYDENAVSGSAQPALYDFLYESKYQAKPKSFRYDVLVKNKKPVSQRVTGQVTEHDRSLLFYRIQSALSEFHHSMKTGYWRLAEQGHWRCSPKWCGYYHACPKGKK